MKKLYVTPSLVACSLSAEDILTGSSFNPVEVVDELATIKERITWGQMDDISSNG